MTVANSSLSQQYILDIELEGRLTFPQEIQQILNLESGDRLILTLEDSGKLQLVSLKAQLIFRGVLIFDIFLKLVYCDTTTTSHKICPCPQNSLILTIYLFQVV